jgi:uncharacterized membrane protein (DUF2068 family)
VTGKKSSSRRVILLIAAFKLLKGVLLLAAAFGTLKLLHKDVAAEVANVLDMFQINPNHLYIQRLLDKFSGLNDDKLKAISAGAFFYAGLLLTEGTGLALQKRWGEYFSIIVTSSFIPLEIYELVKHPSVAKGFVLLINIAVVAYLVREVRRSPEEYATSSASDPRTAISR